MKNPFSLILFNISQNFGVSRFLVTSFLLEKSQEKHSALMAAKIVKKRLVSPKFSLEP